MHGSAGAEQEPDLDRMPAPCALLPASGTAAMLSYNVRDGACRQQKPISSHYCIEANAGEAEPRTLDPSFCGMIMWDVELSLLVSDGRVGA